MAADAGSRTAAYVDRVTTRVWPFFREYWLDGLIILLAVAGALEIATSEGEHGAPTLPIALGILVELGLTLVLLLRRQFPFAAPASMLIAAAAVSFVDGRFIPFTFAGFLAALTACFLLGMLEERRQALIGLGLSLGALAIIIVNDPAPTGVDAAIIPIVFIMIWLFGFGLGRKLESVKEAEERAWRTVNAQEGGGRNSGSGRKTSRSEAAKKGWETRRKRASR